MVHRACPGYGADGTGADGEGIFVSALLSLSPDEEKINHGDHGGTEKRRGVFCCFCQLTLPKTTKRSAGGVGWRKETLGQAFDSFSSGRPLRSCEKAGKLPLSVA